MDGGIFFLLLEEGRIQARNRPALSQAAPSSLSRATLQLMFILALPPPFSRALQGLLRRNGRGQPSTEPVLRWLKHGAGVKAQGQTSSWQGGAFASPQPAAGAKTGNCPVGLTSASTITTAPLPGPGAADQVCSVLTPSQPVHQPNQLETAVSVQRLRWDLP